MSGICIVLEVLADSVLRRVCRKSPCPSSERVRTTSAIGNARSSSRLALNQQNSVASGASRSDAASSSSSFVQRIHSNLHWIRQQYRGLNRLLNASASNGPEISLAACASKTNEAIALSESAQPVLQTQWQSFIFEYSSQLGRILASGVPSNVSSPPKENARPAHRPTGLRLS